MAGGADTRLTLSWRERGGPQIQPPDEKGFGSTLIERLIGRQFGGTAKFEFAPEGLLFRAAFPVPIAAEPADEAFNPGRTKR
jgi:two-component sensor histidine kinase